ncbi:uncharacterized protein C8R40DRAFT_1266423 [Lentinula edodes]|uniref:uncharacterized protein n=1 Tax=Lentinula edodes TaxID=5353 RepID=UPI001E8D7ECA|nr:uncharacterized protein C8R40DRAFT_1266423 [Lentinula edodes]KAH7873137.1 hypothetical protein C8R40DRAFT_1266423 [Lentinula edodes]
MSLLVYLRLVINISYRMRYPMDSGSNSRICEISESVAQGMPIIIGVHLYLKEAQRVIESTKCTVNSCSTLEGRFPETEFGSCRERRAIPLTYHYQVGRAELAANHMSTVPVSLHCCVQRAQSFCLCFISDSMCDVAPYLILDSAAQQGSEFLSNGLKPMAGTTATVAKVASFTFGEEEHPLEGIHVAAKVLETAHNEAMFNRPRTGGKGDSGGVDDKQAYIHNWWG